MKQNIKLINTLVASAVLVLSTSVANADTVIDAPAELVRELTAVNYRLGVSSGRDTLSSFGLKEGGAFSFSFAYPSQLIQPTYSYSVTPPLRTFFENNQLGIANQTALLNSVDNAQELVFNTVDELQFISSGFNTVNTILGATEVDDAIFKVVNSPYNGNINVYERFVGASLADLGFENGVDIRTLDPAAAADVGQLTETLTSEVQFLAGEVIASVSNLDLNGLPSTGDLGDLNGLTDTLGSLPTGDILGDLGGGAPELGGLPDLAGALDPITGEGGLLGGGLPSGDVLGGVPGLADLGGLEDLGAGLAAPQDLLANVLGDGLPTDDLLGGLNGGAPDLVSVLDPLLGEGGLLGGGAPDLGGLDAIGGLPTGDVLGGALPTGDVLGVLTALPAGNLLGDLAL